MMNLPPEIIEKIFLELYLSETISPPHRRDPKLLVTWVCSQWRAIALAMPSLWANIRIPIDSPSSHDYIRAWISRSAQSALSVAFYGPAYSATPSTEIFDLIVSQAIQRCVSLKLCINEPTLKRLFTLPPGSLHALRSISIRPIPSRHKIYSIPYVTAFQQCPWLHRVTFTFVADNLDLAYLNLPWHQLTYLDVSSCSLLEYECLDVLRQCIALQECKISTFTTPLRDLQRIETLSIRPIVLPSLHTLCLDLSHPSLGDSTRFFHALRFPCLRSFRTSLPPSCRMLPMFQYLLSGSISHLYLRWATMDLLAALALVPNLEVLKLRDVDVEVLWVLGRGAAPRLVTLKLNQVDSHDLFDMLEARAAVARVDNGIIMLKDVSAVDSGAGDINTERLAALRAAGVRVVFRNKSL